jgi:cytochrome oxidase Cu insertion factor (SCO1/SenC/PrrC family)
MTHTVQRPPLRAIDREEAQALAGLVALFTITAAWWALALWPLESGPVWLERTRYVCFGVSESGLPDAAGWIGLIGGPAGMLIILLAGWRRGLVGVARRARGSRALAALLAGLALGGATLVTGAAVRVQQAQPSAAWPEEAYPLPSSNYPRLDRAAPPLVLTSQHGGLLDLAAFRGQPVLVTFAYAHCATICPLIVTHALKAQDALRGSDDEPAVLVVTLDPWRDPPSRLMAMARSWGFPEHGAWVLSGSVGEVESTLDDWEVPRTRDETNGEVTHPALVYIVDRDGRLMYAATGGVDALVALVRRL